MQILIKQLKLNNLIIFPQTSAEAVAIKHHKVITKLTDVLDSKIEEIITPAGSGLKAVKSNENVFISHTNSIQPNTNPLNCKILYDSNGHIFKTAIIGKKDILINNQPYMDLDSSKTESIKFGDDFTTDSDNNIQLTWKNT